MPNEPSREISLILRITTKRKQDEKETTATKKKSTGHFVASADDANARQI